ncbi:glycoside hydrolase family 13 protein [Haloarcula onubensis]|uniref:Alpha-glucosidase n=1 Tax=Haloarcula onubensis TaxID=2950539 RepID=A0ABU2FNU9_9EURY|nr:alpha-glucosidase [Halomicroarcula sp. S3CR25-11]MDS0282436.1 alpha-glucosidase [Halomicroarcula sp. S3CR25-11]
MNANGTPDRQWWKEAVVYQIYPRSFNDSDGDGVGDLPGITQKVGYLDDLGVDVVWLCPVYGSPNADNGYDISDYRSIADEFGTMADWEALRSELHAHDMRLLMDLVVNHTSDEHEWFQRSRRREAGYEDYYYWRDGGVDANGDPVPPNNWESFMGGSAWTYDDAREQWYLHLFDEKQPDLNWRNPDVRDEIASLVEWWLEKGIDGFRIDAINYISKPEGLPDGTADREPKGIEVFSHGPRIHDYLRELYERTFANYDVMTVAEMADTTVEMAENYLGEDGDGLNMIFHFEHMGVDISPRGRFDPSEWGEWSLPEFKRIMSRWQTDLDAEGWNATYLGNHDQPRIVSRFGDDEAYRTESAKLLATFLLTTRGTPFVYQGEEIGMTNDDFPELSALDDPMTVGAIEDLFEAGRADSYAELREFVNYVSRDHARTPMQWADAASAGFTTGEPWFAPNENYPDINVAAARADEESVWHYYRRLIDLRHEEDVLVYGEYDLLLPEDEQLYVYRRALGDETVLVVLNWSNRPATVDAGVVDGTPLAILQSNYDDSPADPAGQQFRPYEAVVYRL